jgi:hypothetical protein
MVFALFKNDTHRLVDWVTGHILGWIGGLFLVVYGLMALVRPDVILRWLRSAYPDANLEGTSAQLFVRALGAFVCGLGLLALKSL